MRKTLFDLDRVFATTTCRNEEGEREQDAESPRDSFHTVVCFTLRIGQG